MEVLATCRVERQFLPEAPLPLASKVLTSDTTLTLLGRTRPAATAELAATALGGRRVLGVQERGFHLQEWKDGVPYRWTDGNARLTIPIAREHLPTALALDLVVERPSGAKVEVRMDGRNVFAEQISPGGFSKVVNLEGSSFGGPQLTIDLASETFRPRLTDPRSTDVRKIGVGVREIRLIPAGSQ
jgi:hypothetical protein